MRWFIITVALACIAAAPAVAQDLDAVKADAKNHKVVFENEQVRVVKYSVPPHGKTAMHSHPALVSILLTDANAKATTADGKNSEIHGKAGSAAWRGPVTHVVENVADQPLDGILVEPKKPASALPPGSQDEVTVDPQNAKVEFENEQVRVVRYHYAPGDKSPMHGHPDNVQIVLTDAKANITTADGKTAESLRKAGDVNWRPAASHAVQNTGDQPFEGILVEMKGMGAEKSTGK